MSVARTRAPMLLGAPVSEKLNQSLEVARETLVEEFAGIFGRQTVQRCVDDSYVRLLPASIQGFLPLLAQRFARERLRAAARAIPDAPGAAARQEPLVLFVCTGNSGRSQMAAALLRQRSGGAVQVASAGTQPRDQVQPEVLAALGEAGIETGELFPKPVTDEVVSGADVVITMGCGDSCPVLPGRRYLDWEVADPAGADLAAVRAIRDDIAQHVSDLLAELGMASPAAG